MKQDHRSTALLSVSQFWIDHNHHTAYDVDNTVEDPRHSYVLDDVVCLRGWMNADDFDDDVEYNDDDDYDGQEYDSEQ